MDDFINETKVAQRLHGVRQNSFQNAILKKTIRN